MSHSMRLLLPAATALTLTIVAAVSLARSAEISGDLAVTGAWARATPPGAKVGAVYVTIENRGGGEDSLVSAATPLARSVTLHETVEADGVATMRPLANPVIAPGRTLAMEPGGIHLMLMGLSGPLREGEAIPLTLVFEEAGQVAVSAQVEPIGAAAPADLHHHHPM